jgi:hypothetical protein
MNKFNSSDVLCTILYLGFVLIFCIALLWQGNNIKEYIIINNCTRTGNIKYDEVAESYLHQYYCALTDEIKWFF